MSTWKTKCKECDSYAYYSPDSIILEAVQNSNSKKEEDLSPRIVDIKCIAKEKHHGRYLFPKEFTKV